MTTHGQRLSQLHPRKKWFIACAILVCILLAAILAKSPPAKEDTGSFPDSYIINKENRFDYQSGLECSAYASAYVLRSYGVEADGIELYKTYPNKVADGSGVYPSGIKTFFKNKDYNIDFFEQGSIEGAKRAISKGVPIIAFIRIEAESRYTHYVPMIGYDEEYFYLAESLPQYANCQDAEGLPYNRKEKIAYFEEIWSDVEGMYNIPYFVISK